MISSFCTDTIGFLGALLAILNPVAAVPTFVTVTAARPNVNRRHVAATAAATVGLILGGAGLFGEGILSVFGTDLNSFRIGGGLIVVISGLRMALGVGVPAQEEAENGAGAAVGAVPIGLPLICGPTSISMVILQASGPGGKTPVLVVVAIVALIVWLTLTIAEPLFKRFGVVGIEVATRLSGMLLSSIGASLLLHGARAALGIGS
jgi:multiple antibiotic resistance protein